MWMMSEILYTVGHSNRSLDDFLLTIKSHSIGAIADVRSYPYSNMNPQFDRESLSASLNEQGIAYVFLGKELGARSNEPSCYEDGKVQYERLARTELFQEGLVRVLQGMERYRVALMCAEKEPLACHRTILVSRHLVERGIRVRHILSSTEVEDHVDATNRLLHELDLDEANLFCSKADLITEAYRVQGSRIAYQREDTAISAAQT